MTFLRKHMILLTLGALVLLVAVGALPFYSTLDGHNMTERLVRWGNYGQWFGIVGGTAGVLAFLCALYMVTLQHHQVEEANRQTQEAQEQTRAVIEVLNRQVEMSGIAALLQYLIAYQFKDGIDSPEQMQEKARQCKERLEKVLKPY